MLKTPSTGAPYTGSKFASRFVEVGFVAAEVGVEEVGTVVPVVATFKWLAAGADGDGTVVLEALDSVPFVRPEGGEEPEAEDEVEVVWAEFVAGVDVVVVEVVEEGLGTEEEVTHGGESIGSVVAPEVEDDC